MMTLTKLENISLRQLSLSALLLMAGCLLMFAALAWNIMQQSQRDLAALELVNVQQASSLNRLHIASLEGLNRMDRALERQLRPSLGDPIAALEAAEYGQTTASSPPVAIWPFKFAAPVGVLALALQMAATSYRYLAGHLPHAADDDEAHEGEAI